MNENIRHHIWLITRDYIDWFGMKLLRISRKLLQWSGKHCSWCGADCGFNSTYSAKGLRCCGFTRDCTNYPKV